MLHKHQYINCALRNNFNERLRDLKLIKNKTGKKEEIDFEESSLEILKMKNIANH